MKPIKLLLLALVITLPGDAYVNWKDRVHELRLEECIERLLPEVLLSREVRLPQSSCIRDLTIYRQAIARRDLWAVEMLDSSSKMPFGLMQGNFINLGMFDQCLDVVDNENKIRGRHCTYSLYPADDENVLPLYPMLSICMPESCNQNDIEWLVNDTIFASEKLKELGVKVGNTNCTIVEPRTISLRFIIFLLFLGSYIAFLVFCTHCDIVKSKGGTVKWIKPHLLQILINFSMLKSAKAILSFKTHPDSLPVIDGLRVLSNMGVILVHVYLFHFLDLNSNIFYVQKWLPQLSAMVPLICVFCVDTFLVLTGFLTAYGFFKKMQQGKQPSIPRYYLHRYMRLTLPMLMVAVLTIEFAPFIEIGPRHNFITGILIKGCSSKLWSYFIYAHNYVQRNDLCLVHLWSLAVDMQLYWISPFIFYPLYKKPKIGLSILVSLLLTSVISTASLVWINKYSAIYIDQELTLTRLLKTVSDIHINTLTRASPWLLGALFGYEVVQKNIKPNKMLMSLGWLLPVGTFAFVAWGIAIFTNVHYEYNITLEVIFAGLSKPAWAFSICWIIYASLNGYGGFISTILSCKIFLPLSRLAYGLYLTHPILPVIKLASARTQNFFHQQFILLSFIEIMTSSLVLGFCFSVLFEVPMFVLENLLFRKQDSIKKEDKEE